MAITEAMACGCPVVISEACHFPEVASADAGEVLPLDTPQIAAALQRMFNDSQRRNLMGLAGRKLVLQRYTWPEIARQAVSTYQEMLKARTR